MKLARNIYHVSENCRKGLKVRGECQDRAQTERSNGGGMHFDGGGVDGHFFIPFYASRLQLLSKFSGIRRAVELSVTFILSEVHATGALDYTM